MNKRILHIGKYFSPFKGGIEKVMQDLMEQQSQTNDVYGLVHHHEALMGSRCERAKKSIIIRLSILGRFIFSPISISAIVCLPHFIKRIQPDVLHLHVPNLTCFILLLSKRAKQIPWVLHWHSDVIGEQANWKLKLFYPMYKIFETALLKQANKVVVTSPEYLKTSKPLFVFAEKCSVIPLGLEQQVLSIKTNAKVHSSLKILCIGRFTYYKGHEYLISAVEKAIKNKQPIELCLVGNGELLNQYKQWLQQKKLNDIVTIRTGLSDKQVLAQLLEADVFCLPSIERTEAFGVVLLEAMRAGKPCICTNVVGSGMSHVVVHQKTGYVVQHNSADALYKALQCYINSPEKLTVHGMQGRKRFEDMFTIAKINEKWSALYAQL